MKNSSIRKIEKLEVVKKSQLRKIWGRGPGDTFSGGCIRIPKRKMQSIALSGNPSDGLPVSKGGL